MNAFTFRNLREIESSRIDGFIDRVRYTWRRVINETANVNVFVDGFWASEHARRTSGRCGPRFRL